ncbi:MAG: hypothetical protein AB8B97_05275 [Granulosicoccus sp.]
MQESYRNPVHACFRLDIKFPITVANAGDLFQLWQSLSYRIVRQPDDLLTHTRRIRLCHEHALNDRLAGSIADLAYVLNGRGTALLVRLRAESLKAVNGQVHLPELDDEEHFAQVLTKGRVLPTMTQLLVHSRVTDAPAPAS